MCTYLSSLRPSTCALQTATMVTLCFAAIIPMWGVLGFIKGSGIGFLHPWEAYLLGVFYGLALGSFQSYNRCLFSEMIPKEREAEFFALYEITDRVGGEDVNVARHAF